MARIRTIKPQHVTDKELSKISLQAHLLWVLSWCFSDDEGVFENDPLLLKSQIFPRRTDIRIEQIEKWLDQLTEARFIIPFTHQGEGYYIHRTFKTHQKIDRPQESKVPSTIIRRILDERSTTQQPCIVEESIVEESKGEIPVFVEPEIAFPFDSEDFMSKWESWKSYKKKEHKFNYKSAESEQATLNELVNLSEGKEQLAIDIILQSMAKGWKGFFKIKTNENGQFKKPTGSEVSTEHAFNVIDQFYSKNGSQ